MTATVWVELWDGRRWPGRLAGDLPTFPFKLAPEGLATRRQLRERGLCPGGRVPWAQLEWSRGRRHAWLYVIDWAKPSPGPIAGSGGGAGQGDASPPDLCGRPRRQSLRPAL